MALKIAIAIGALGFLPLLIVLWKRRRVINLVKYGDIVTGTVLEVYTHTGYKGSTYYQAVIEYPVFNQAPIQGNYMFSGTKGLKMFYRGRRLDICYDKEKPKRFVPKEAPMHPIGLIFTIIVAIGIAVVSYCLYNTMRESGIN